MKKRLNLIAVLAALLALTFVGCGITSTNIVGEWEGELTYQTMKIKVTLDFSKDGTGKYWTEIDDKKDEAEPFKWELSSSELTIKFENGTTVSTDDIKDNPDKFSITIPLKELSGGFINEDWNMGFYKK